MPDISKCKGETKKGFICPMRDTCYRFTAKPSEFMQLYFTTPPLFGKKCDFYMIDEQKEWEKKHGKDERNVQRHD